MTRYKLFYSIFYAVAFAVLTSFGIAQVQLEQQTFEISRQLRCPVCTAESVADSASEVAIQMRNIVQEQLTEGKSEAEILAYFQARYGDWILLDPPKRGLHLVVWLLPIVGGVLGIVTLALLFRRWTRKSSQVPEVDEADRQRVREAMSGMGGNG